RGHAVWVSDLSSDVCSSDLSRRSGDLLSEAKLRGLDCERLRIRCGSWKRFMRSAGGPDTRFSVFLLQGDDLGARGRSLTVAVLRSEERRVGKGGGTRLSRDQ